MSRFNKNVSSIPEVSTASLPDIVFMLLFFFMTVTVMKDTTLKVDNVLPNATETKKLEKKDRVISIHIGRPTKDLEEALGTEPRIQLEDKFAYLSDVGPYVLAKIAQKPEHLRPYVTISLKVDKKAGMGIIQDVKQELRKVGALKINYTTYEGEAVHDSSSHPKLNGQ
ncbi:biopolymer transporter ExbD [Aggregatimonas sangjinii]|uniref:Biopolymer transporter ExbD n=1 Tax=Aggregatimonas sangjinii TaxID=2583587 RepID=A0A5B7SVS6_9FLAO|nr:biopolymer transporter ExbD [Aggregatimonas sangjinii]QCX01263.1 biopolymer transporter ExbD [Aggregatimonas sangjinii]